MRLSKIIDGLTILRRHYTNPDGYHLSAEHDQIYLRSTDTPLTPEEAAEMFKLGWFQPDAREKSYQCDCGWSAFA